MERRSRLAFNGTPVIDRLFMRSKLFVPASRTELYTKALAGPADALSFDLEDAVEEGRKPEARQALQHFMREPAAGATGKTIIVRVNALGTAHCRADVEAGMAKLFASEAALEIATDAMRIHGGVGYTTDLPVERYFRDAPLMIIGEGTNEIQRTVIARGLLRRYSTDG